MDGQEKTLHTVELHTAGPLTAALPTMPRRALHRVETAALDLTVGVRARGDVNHGHLLNVSAGGCSVRMAFPITLILDSGTTFDVILPHENGALVCAGELVGLDMGKGSASLRLRFRALAPETRRTLLSWIGEVLTRDFQMRHTGGNHTWSAKRS